MSFLDTILNSVAGMTKPFAMGANLLAKGYGDLYRGVSGNTGYVSPLEEFIRSGITQEDMQRIEKNPYKEIAKSGAGMTATLMPFATGGFGAINIAKNPLVNKTIQYAARGGVPGALGGFGYSPDGQELRNTLIGGGLGAGAGIAGGYLFDSGYRQLMNQAIKSGNSGMYPGSFTPGGTGGSIEDLRRSAYEAAKVPPGEMEKLQKFYEGKNALDHSNYLKDIELLQRGSVKNAPEIGKYLQYLRDQGLVDPKQVDMLLQYEYGIPPIKSGYQSEPLRTITSKELAKKAVRAEANGVHIEIGPDNTARIGDAVYKIKKGAPSITPVANPLRAISPKEAAEKAVKAVNANDYNSFGWGPNDTFYSGPDTFRIVRPPSGL